MPDVQTRTVNRRTPRKPTKRVSPTYSLYVIRLKRPAADMGKVRKANPDAKPGKPVVYVGMTSKTPEERFAVHVGGGQHASSIVTTYGKRLFPWAYRNCRTYATKDAAESAERALAERYRQKGWTVWQN